MLIAPSQVVVGIYIFLSRPQPARRRLRSRGMVIAIALLMQYMASGLCLDGQERKRIQYHTMYRPSAS